MSQDRRSPPPSSPSDDPRAATPQTIHIHNHPRSGGWGLRLALVLLLISIGLNLSQMAAYRDYQGGLTAPYERFADGELTSSNKIALLEIDGVIMPPYTERTLETIKRISEDDAVKGVVLAIDSPGGLVADSHRIYAELKKLREKKPMVVSMGRLAASGGYYVAMGAGPESKLFAEETTWTGSIGVIIPRFDLTELGNKIGVHSDPLKTGPLKDALDPLKPLSEEERRVWDTILTESLDEFVRVIDGGRAKLSEPDVRRLATGQIFTARQALRAGLVDEIGDQDAAIESLKQQLQLSEVRVVKYEHPKTLVDSLLGSEAPVGGAARDPWSRLLEASVPRAMYLFGWQAGWSTP